MTWFMKNALRLAAFALLLANPFSLIASSNSCEKIIKNKDVAGTYQIHGFSNSLDGIGSPSQPQSQAIIGQAIFRKDGTGVIPFVDLTVIINNEIVSIHQENVLFTYTLGPINGSGTATVFDFPAPGVNPTFALAFKSKNGKVRGFSQLIVENNVPTARWTLIQGKRFN